MNFDMDRQHNKEFASTGLMGVAELNNSVVISLSYCIV
jgi:hypothetical protein